MQTARHITSNQPCYPIGGRGGFTAEQFAEMLQAKMMILPIRCLLGASNIDGSASYAHDFVRQLKTADVKVIVYAQLMHNLSGAASAWEWERVLQGKHGPPLLWGGLWNSTPAVRQVRQGGAGDWLYSDPRTYRYAEWAQLVGQTVIGCGADGVLVDHIQKQFTGPAATVLNQDEALVDKFQAVTITSLVDLRDELGPGRWIIPNGSWALDDTGLVGRAITPSEDMGLDPGELSWAGGPTSGVYVERMGGHWHSPKEVAPLLAAHLHDHGGIVLLDPRRGGKTSYHYDVMGLVFEEDQKDPDYMLADDLNDILATHWADALGNRAYVVRPA